jgi:hypothetical protein
MTKESDSNEANKRQAERHLACFAAQLAKEDGKQRTAVIRDLSVTGALILTRARMTVGETLTLELYLTPEMDEKHTTGCKVVRVEELEPGASGLWSRIVGVQFDAPLSHLEAQIKQIADAQARVMGRTP